MNISNISSPTSVPYGIHRQNRVHEQTNQQQEVHGTHSHGHGHHRKVQQVSNQQSQSQQTISSTNNNTGTTISTDLSSGQSINFQA